MRWYSLFSGIRYGRYDKTVHLVISCVATVIAALFVEIFWAAAIVIALGIVKELIDIRYSQFKFDINDIIVNVLGVGLAVIVWVSMT